MARIRDTDTIEILSIRYQRPRDGVYDQQTFATLSIQATGQLSGRIDALSATAERHIRRGPYPPGGPGDNPNWGDSSNPAWLLADFLLGIETPPGYPSAGANLPPERIDWAAINDWGAWCETEELECNMVLQSRISVAQVIERICQCGRASPTWQSGKFGVIIDRRPTAPTALITPGNIIVDSFTIAYAAAQLADNISVRFQDEDNGYELETIRRDIPGTVGGRVATTVTLDGVTNRRQAEKELNIIAARQAYHRRTFTWSMAAEGLAVQRGDQVLITHGLISGGMNGRGIIIDGTTITLSNSQSDVQVRATHAAIRTHDGGIYVVDGFTLGKNTAGLITLTFTELPIRSAAIADANLRDALWRVYNAGDDVRARIIAVEPSADHTFRMSAVDDVNAYYDAIEDFNAIVATTNTNTKQVNIQRIIASDSVISAGKNNPIVQISITIVATGPWAGGAVFAGRDDDNLEYQLTMPATTNQASWISEQTGMISIRVSPLAGTGNPHTIQYTVRGLLYPPDPPTNIEFYQRATNVREISWSLSTAVDLLGYQIRYIIATESAEWDAMTPAFSGSINSSPYLGLADAPAGNYRIAVRSIDTSGILSDYAPADAIHAVFAPQRGDEITVLPSIEIQSLRYLPTTGPFWSVNYSFQRNGYSIVYDSELSWNSPLTWDNAAISVWCGNSSLTRDVNRFFVYTAQFSGTPFRNVSISADEYSELSYSVYYAIGSVEEGDWRRYITPIYIPGSDRYANPLTICLVISAVPGTRLPTPHYRPRLYLPITA